jgi:signal transduction histidine kinase
MAAGFEQDVAAVASIKAIPSLLSIVCRTTGMRFAAVARVTEDRWIACSVRDEIAFGLKPGGELKVETTICHEIRQSGEAVIIDHVSADPTYAGHHTPRIYGLESYISMPIRLSDGSFFGTLCAIDPEPHKLNTPEVIEMFETFAAIIGYHLSTIDRMNLAEASLLNERQASALREQFIAILGHDLRNPLASIDAGAKLLKRAPLDQRSSSILAMMQSSVFRMAKLIDNILDFARGRLGGGLTLNREANAPLKSVLDLVISELRTIWSDRPIEVSFGLTAPVDCDASRIGQLFSNLLGNALTHGSSAAPIRVAAATQDDVFTLSVSNSGNPISDSAREHLFAPFYRGEHKPGGQGLGLGLYIASEIARAHGGTIEVVSTPESACFTFRMALRSIGNSGRSQALRFS